TTSSPRPPRLFNRLQLILWSAGLLLLTAGPARAGEAALAIPDLREGHFTIFGQSISAWNLLFYGACVIAGTLSISLYQLAQIKKQPAHRSMLNVADIIFQTCKTYLIQQGKFLLMLFALIACAITYYLLGFGGGEGGAEATPSHISPGLTVVLVLL